MSKIFQIYVYNKTTDNAAMGYTMPQTSARENK
jgi:hypothetical protein